MYLPEQVGQTQEEEMPESRAEYDADSGIELPSVSRLRAMFGTTGGRSGNRLEPDEGNFKRVRIEFKCTLILSFLTQS